MCGVIGLVATSEVSQTLFDGLTVLQHRGQDAAGMATCQGSQFALCKGNGLVREVFHNSYMQQLKGKMGIGHVRYPTAGTSSKAEAQPFYVNSPFGIMLVHNGNLTNTSQLQQELFYRCFRHLNTLSDSEVILNVFANELEQTNPLTHDNIFKAVQGVHQRCRGGYAIVAMIANVGLVAFRDPFGIRPLIMGQRQTALGREIMVASESVALTSQGFTILDDVGPGEAVVITQDGTIYQRSCAKNAQLSPCLFEYVYFARPDSVIDKISVYKVRMNIGKKLAAIIQKQWPLDDIDVIIPIPETSRHAALVLAQELKLEFREGFVKNRYLGRTFIMPGQAIRKKSVRQKLSVIESECRDKNVLLVDDSIVRGTTSQEIIQMAREAGARKVYFASAAPPIRYPNVYGIDTPCARELIAHEQSIDQIKHLIGADELIYLDLADLINAARKENPSIVKFESAMFDGIYLTGDESDYLAMVSGRKTNDVFSECNGLNL